MEELICREGTIHSVIFQNAENGYTVLRLLTEEGEAVTVVGCIPCAAPGERLTVTGVWERHPQHGEQLRASEVERSLPEDEEEIFSYLSSGVLKGVGPATARNIVERFGLEAARPQWRESTNWAGLLIAVGNEYARDNPKTIRQRQKAVRDFCRQPEMQHAIRTLKPVGLSPNKQMVANLVRGKHFFTLTQLYRLKNRI